MGVQFIEVILAKNRYMQTLFNVRCI